MHIRYTKIAVEDLKEIFSYIAQDSIKKAHEYVDLLQKKIELLAEFPKIGIECKNRNIDEDCKIYIFENYLIFYTVAKDSIEIRRVLHSSVDYIEKLI